MTANKTMMSRDVTRWYAAEVCREWVANDNEGMAEWAARWTEVAEMMKAKGWRNYEMAMRAMVAMGRQANRPEVVR